MEIHIMDFVLWAVIVFAVCLIRKEDEGIEGLVTAFFLLVFTIGWVITFVVVDYNVSDLLLEWWQDVEIKL